MYTELCELNHATGTVYKAGFIRQMGSRMQPPCPSASRAFTAANLGTKGTYGKLPRYKIIIYKGVYYGKAPNVFRTVRLDSLSDLILVFDCQFDQYICCTGKWTAHCELRGPTDYVVYNRGGHSCGYHVF